MARALTFGWHGVDEQNMIHLSCGTYGATCLLLSFPSMDKAGVFR